MQLSQMNEAVSSAMTTGEGVSVLDYLYTSSSEGLKDGGQEIRLQWRSGRLSKLPLAVALGERGCPGLLCFFLPHTWTSYDAVLSLDTRILWKGGQYQEQDIGHHSMQDQSRLT